MKKKWLTILLALAICAMTACGGSAETPASEPAAQADAATGSSEAAPVTDGADATSGGVPVEELKVGVISNSVRDANSFFQAHDMALKATAEKLGMSEDQITWVENVPISGGDALDVIDTLANDGYQVILSASSSYHDAVATGAERYPDIKFIHFSGAPAGGNLSTYQNRDYQSLWLTGYLAAKVSDVDQLGFVALFPEQSVVRAINSFADGARYANENATVQLLFTNSWFDPPKEKESAQSLMAAGVQVIGTDAANPAVLQAAEELGGYSFGFNVDMQPFAPKSTLTSYLALWEPIFTDAIGSVIDGTWDGQHYFWGIDKGATDIAPVNADLVSQDIIDEVEALRAQIISGEVVPFTGPLNDNNGNVVVADGEVMSDEMLLTMDFLLENVKGSLQ